MELIERADYFSSLEAQLDKTIMGKGHCVFISGESGIGKTSLVNSFCQAHKDDYAIYTGLCDALFTPRPLAPLYDIAWQISEEFGQISQTYEDRTTLFARFFHALSQSKQPTIIVFEDIHWADEATLDFIKFFARRISQTTCLFLLTYRDNEIHAQHPLRNVLGELVPGSFTRLLLPPLSRQAVEKLSMEKGYKGDDVYHISGGNPFYVQEILASYSPGIPDTIRDSVLSVYNRQDTDTKYNWERLAILPTGMEITCLDKLDPHYTTAIEKCLSNGILIIRDGVLLFKHELYRRTLEESLSPLKRIELNKQILDLYREYFEANKQIERIVHHAKNANAYEIVVRYAPEAAIRAACVGAHIEAAKLYLTAITYYQGSDPDVLLPFYEAYAYECYLTNQIDEAIIYQGKALTIRKQKNESEKIGDSLRFLSRLWWFNGNRNQAEKFAKRAIDVLEHKPSSRAKGMAFSNMSQLKMLANQPADCLFWGQKAIDIAHKLQDNEMLAHALTNIGTAHMNSRQTREKGIDLVKQSLAISLHNAYHDHAARAYTNLSYQAVDKKDYTMAQQTLDAGLLYCEERELDALKNYMLSIKARLSLETGQWAQALAMASQLLEGENQTPLIKVGALTVQATIQMRGGHPGALSLLEEAKKIAFKTQEPQRIVPVMIAILEYEWLTGTQFIDQDALQYAIQLVEQTDHFVQNSAFAFWLMKARNQPVSLPERYEGYDFSDEDTYQKAVLTWERLGCPYEQAILLLEGSEEDKRKAIIRVDNLGAGAVCEKMKQEMRAAGINKIPRGIRETTRSNPAQLTNRELSILALLQQSMQNKEIAEKLFISPKTVDHHISSILLKLDVNSRAKAVREASELGILK